MQKITVLITNNRVFTFHNAGASTLDSTDFLGFECKKKQEAHFFFSLKKTWSPLKFNFRGLHVFCFFKILRKNALFIFLHPNPRKSVLSRVLKTAL